MKTEDSIIANFFFTMLEKGLTITDGKHTISIFLGKQNQSFLQEDKEKLNNKKLNNKNKITKKDILRIIRNETKGINIKDLAEKLNVSYQKILIKTLSLVKENRIKKDDDAYFPILKTENNNEEIQQE